MSPSIVHRVESLFVLVLLLIGTTWAVSARPQGASLASTTNFTFTPVADAYVSHAHPSTNYGASQVLRADASPIVRSYIRFVVAGLNGSQVQSARLRLYANNSSAAGFSVRTLSDNTWSESKITYNNAPAPGSLINSSKAFSAGTWVEVDLSSYVKSEAAYSVVITTASSAEIDLSSREAPGRAPQLVISALAPASATVTAAATRTNTPVPTATAMPSANPTSQTSWQPSFPIRAAFYYPWFPEAWTQHGIYPYTNYHPQLGYYSSSDTTVIQKHIVMMQYGGIQAAIASWWGQGSQTDSRVPILLAAASGTNFRWALYYELESLGDPTPAQIQSDLTYIRDHYGKDPDYLHVNGKFVVFVYADGNDGCGMADRWKQGNTVGAYVVLKVFQGYLNCASQPDDWHQYSPAAAEDHQGSHSFSISPGFWLVGNSVRLSRDVTRWTQNVKDMVASGSRWQLVTTFSEWGEGTAVEPAQEWASTTGFGQYLDVLHNNGNVP
ncbi:MAG TPA: DNRLRE domain-containing protein [Anaerolineales bacterium]